jgi:hypothetical protein
MKKGRRSLFGRVLREETGHNQIGFDEDRRGDGGRLTWRTVDFEMNELTYHEMTCLEKMFWMDGKINTYWYNIMKEFSQNRLKPGEKKTKFHDIFSQVYFILVGIKS